jgi:N-acetylmuramoyl-L-alanine amidase
MGRKLLKAVVLFLLTLCFVLVIPVYAQKKLLSVTYPANNHRTKADKIFFIGNAPPQGQVTINGQVVNRSASGNFAPTLPLKTGDNTFDIRYQSEQVQLKITREPMVAAAPSQGFREDGFEPRGQVSRQVGETICFGAKAPENAQVSVEVGNTSIPLQSQNPTVVLPANNAALNDGGEPQAIYGAGQYLGCAVARATGTVAPVYRMESRAQSRPQIQKVLSPARVEILAPANLEVAEVKVDYAIARTGPSSDYSRVTPLPKGARATVVGRQDGDNNGKRATFLRLDYGGWLNLEDLNISTGVAAPPRTAIRSVRSQLQNNKTELRFPLEAAVPLTIEQQEKTLKLTLYNTTAQTDVVRIKDSPVIDRLDWQPKQPSQVEYLLTFKGKQQWGYTYRYEGTTLVLGLRHPPATNRSNARPLAGTKILIDPGHGGKDPGAVGPNGYSEKEAALFASKLLGNELINQGAQVYLSREDDRDVSLDERRAMVRNLEPTLALSVHYNSLPDGGEPAKVKGFSTYWYHSQAQGLANFLHSYVTQQGGRPRYGVTWDNLAMARPAEAPAVLLELGFMSNPEEFEWISNPEAQQQMAKTLAKAVAQWLMTVS